MQLSVLRYTWIPVIFALVIFYLCCLIPANDIPEIELNFIFQTDKFVHFIMYFGFSGVTGLYYVHDKKGNINVLKMLLGAVFIPILYGGFIEIIQGEFFPPRKADWGDFIADILGSLASIPFVFYYRKKLLLKNKTI